MRQTYRITDYSSEECKIGDVYIFTYDLNFNNLLGVPEKITEYFHKQKNPNMVIEKSEVIGDQLLMQCKVTQNPLPFLVVFGLYVTGATVLLVTLGMTLNRVDKVVTDVTDSPVLTTAVSTIGIGTGLALLVGIYWFITKGMKG